MSRPILSECLDTVLYTLAETVPRMQFIRKYFTTEPPSNFFNKYIPLGSVSPVRPQNQYTSLRCSAKSKFTISAGTWCSWLSRPLSMDSSGYSGDPACGRSPVQFRVCPKNRVVHPSCGKACVLSRGNACALFLGAVSAWSAGLALFFFQASYTFCEDIYRPRKLTTLEKARAGVSSGHSQCNLRR